MPDLVKLADAYGCTGRRIATSDLAVIEATITECLADRGSAHPPGETLEGKMPRRGDRTRGGGSANSAFFHPSNRGYTDSKSFAKWSELVPLSN